MSGYLISPPAVLDLDSAWNYLSSQVSLASAEKIIRNIRSKIKFLGDNPLTGTPHEELWGAGLRSAVSEGYVIVHRVDPGRTVIILRIIHGKRDIISLLAETPEK